MSHPKPVWESHFAWFAYFACMHKGEHPVAGTCLRCMQVLCLPPLLCTFYRTAKGVAHTIAFFGCN